MNACISPSAGICSSRRDDIKDENFIKKTFAAYFENKKSEKNIKKKQQKTKECWSKCWKMFFILLK